MEYPRAYTTQASPEAQTIHQEKIENMNPGGISLQKVNFTKRFEDADPGGIKLGNAANIQERAKDTVEAYLQLVDDPESEKAKIDVSQYLSNKLGVSFDSIYNNYEPAIEKIMGQTLEPKDALTLLTDSFKAGTIDIEIAKLGNQKLGLTLEEQESINTHINSLEESKPLVDPYKHNILLDAASGTASMIPFMWDVGKSLIPGMAITAVSGMLGAAPTAATITSTVGKFVSIWGKAASFSEGYKQSTGSLYNTLQDMKDENGDPIDDGIARQITAWAGIPIAGLEAIGADYIFTGSNAFSNVISKIGAKAFKKRMETATAKTMTELTIKGFFQNQAKRMAKNVGEMALYEVLLEEVPQDVIEVQATEMAKHLTNELRDTDFKDITSEEYWAREKEVFTESFKSMFLLGIGKGAIGSLSAFHEYAKGIETETVNKEEAENLNNQNEMADIYANSDDEDTLTEIEKIQEEQQKISESERVETTVKDNIVTAKNQRDETVGTATIRVEDDTVFVDSFEIEGKQASKVMKDIQNTYPEKRIILSETGINSQSARGMEDLNDKVAQQNKRIDGANFTIESAQRNIESNKEDLQTIEQSLQETEDAEEIKILTLQKEQLEDEITNSETDIDVARETIDRATEAKKVIVAKPRKKIETMTPDEYTEAFKDEPHFKDTKAGQNLRTKLKDLSSIQDEAELDIALDLVDMIARKQNLKPIDWLKKTFQNKMITKQVGEDKRASVEFNDDLKALIRLTKESDFSSWVHELSHIFRKQLTGKDLEIATQWAVKETGTKKNLSEQRKNGEWTVAMEEVFASGFEKYIMEGRYKNEIDTVFAKMAEFMVRIYKTLKKNFPDIPKNIQEVFDNQFAPSRLELIKEGTTGNILYQPEHIEAIKEAVELGKPVPIETLEQIDADWAKAELMQVKINQAIVEDFDFLKDTAMDSKTVDEFIENTDLYMGEEAGKLIDKDRPFMEKLYKLLTEEKIVDINTGNKNWISKINEDYVKGLIMGVSKNIKAADAQGMPSLIVMASRRYLRTHTFRPKTIQTIIKTLKNNPSEYRADASEFIGDMEEVRRVEEEKAYSQEIAIEEELTAKKLKKERKDIVEELSDAETKKMVQTGEISSKKAEKLMGKASKEIVDIRDNIKQLNEEIRDLEIKHSDKLDVMIKSRNKEIKEQAQKLKEALAKQKRELRAKVKEQKDKKKARDYMVKLGEQVTKKLPMSIDANYRQMILRVQSKVDPKHRREATLIQRQELRDIYEQNPELAKLLPKGALNKIQAKALNEWTALELEELKETIDQLTYQGKMVLKMRNLTRKALIEKDLSSAVHQVVKHGVFTDKDISNGEAKTRKEKGMEALLKTFRANRMIDMLDAGKTLKGEEYNGLIHRIIWDGITEAYNNEIREKHRRHTNGAKKMKDLGLSRGDFVRKVDIRGTVFTIDKIMDVWTGWQNEKKQAVLEQNMGITQEIYDEMMTHLTEKELELAQYILDDYTESFDRLREAFYLDKNIILDGEENYTPMRVILNGLTADERDISEELLSRKSIRSSLQKNFTKGRVSHNHAIQLGLVETWVGAVDREEHYINNVAKLKHIRAVINNKEFIEAVNSVKKAPILREVKAWLDRYTNPYANKSTKGWDSAIRTLKKGAAIAYLWGNAVTVLKQVPSMVYFASYSGPDFFTGIFSNYKETRSMMEKWSPELTYGRSFEAFVDSLKGQATSQGMYYINKMGEFGLRGIQMMDSMVISVGWRGVYENSRRHGLSEEESARKATQAVLLTQPSSSVKDTAALYADDNMLSMMLMFTNQLNQIFLTLAYDAPQALMHGRKLKFMSTYMASMIGATTLWMISNRRMPEDKEDISGIVSDQFLSLIPGIGKIIGSNVDGYDLSIPALAPLDAMASIFKLSKDVTLGKDITKPQLERALKTMYEGFAIGAGVPYTEVNRVYEGFKNGYPLEYILFGGKLNDK